jgi:hypothetical protein
MPDESEISHQLGVLSGKLDMVLENQRNVMGQISHLEGRIRALESHRGYVMGVVAAVALVWTVLFEFIKARVFGS